MSSTKEPKVSKTVNETPVFSRLLLESGLHTRRHTRRQGETFTQLENYKATLRAVRAIIHKQDL